MLTFGVEVTEELKTAEENFHVDLARLSRNSALAKYVEDINDHIRVARRLGWPDLRSVTDYL